ncbi:GTP-binding protein [Amycolatopsis sp. NPDC004368]
MGGVRDPESRQYADHSHLEFSAVRTPGVARIGIGGPVGSGKTALIEALVPMLVAQGHRPLVVTNDIFTSEDALHVRRTLAGVPAPERVVGVETGSCPHTAVHDDPTMNLDAVAELTNRYPDADVVVPGGGELVRGVAGGASSRARGTVALDAGRGARGVPGFPSCPPGAGWGCGCWGTHTSKGVQAAMHSAWDRVRRRLPGAPPPDLRKG